MLSICLIHSTQNPNESLHARIWSLCPKSKYNTIQVLQFAIAQSVLWYHKGYHHGGLEENLGIEVTEHLVANRHAKEVERLRVRTPKSRRQLKLPTKGGIPEYSSGAHHYVEEHDNDSDYDITSEDEDEFMEGFKLFDVNNNIEPQPSTSKE